MATNFLHQEYLKPHKITRVRNLLIKKGRNLKRQANHCALQSTQKRDNHSDGNIPLAEDTPQPFYIVSHLHLLDQSTKLAMTDPNLVQIPAKAGCKGNQKVETIQISPCILSEANRAAQLDCCEMHMFLVSVRENRTFHAKCCSTKNKRAVFQKENEDNMTLQSEKSMKCYLQLVPTIPKIQ